MRTQRNRDPLAETALVLVFPDPGAALFHGEVNRLVTEVEDRVGGAFVTFALLNGRQPSLMDAISAARFMGCTSAVVAVVGDRLGPSVEAVPRAWGEMPMTVASCGRDPEAIADAFAASVLAEPAACA